MTTIGLSAALKALGGALPTFGLALGTGDTVLEAYAAETNAQLANALTSNTYDWLIDLDRWVRELGEQRAIAEAATRGHDEVIEEMRAELHSALTNSTGVYWKLLGSYRVEAARSAERARLDMLAQAAAFAILGRLDIAQVIRVERALRDLDPVDVRLLHQLAHFEATYPLPLMEKNREMLATLRGASPVGFSLEQSMCVRLVAKKNTWGEMEGIEITPVGRDVILSTPAFAAET